MVSALSDIFDFAIQNGHCRFNPAQYIFIKHRDRFEELDEVNNAIGKRFLLISELRSIMNKCLKKITSGAFEYLSVILRLFTGLEANIISALKWKDFVPYETDDGETRYYLSTERQISRNGKSIEPLRRLEQSRHFPLIEPIAQLLLKRKEFLLASDTNFTIERLLETPIIPGSHQIDLLTSILPPQKINKLCLEMVKGLDIPDNYLPLPDNRYGLVEANLNAFKNDIYKNTFRHYLLRVRELSLGDIVFLLGTQAQNVDYKNYIDCMSNGNQERIEKALFKAWIICMEEKDE